MMFAALIAAAIACRPVVVLCHEAGHALAAKLTGREVIDITIGKGSLLSTFRLFDTTIILRRYIFAGALTRYADLKQRRTRVGNVLIAAAGPGANLALTAVMGLFSYWASTGRSIGHQNVAAALSGIALSSALMAALNLIPMRVHAGSVRSDGLQILQNLMHLFRPVADPFGFARVHSLIALGRFADAAEAVRRLPEGPEPSCNFFGLAIHCISRAHGDEAAVDWYERHADEAERVLTADGDGVAGSRSWLQANIAWSVLKARRIDLYQLGDRLSVFASSAEPSGPEIMGTRGAWLIEAGQHAEGLRLLTDAVRQVRDPIDKADFCIFLARASQATGSDANADGFQKLRAHLVNGEGLRI